MKLSNRDSLVVSILKDAIIFQRISNAMFRAVNAFNNGMKDFEPEQHYSGLSNALQVLGIDDSHEIRDELVEVFLQDLEKDSEVSADAAALDIFYRWAFLIKDFYTTKLSA